MLEKRETKKCDNSFYHPWIKRGHPIWELLEFLYFTGTAWAGISKSVVMDFDMGIIQPMGYSSPKLKRFWVS